ncbi:helix-turn-helix domain-containing protein [Dysgonomonas macrotermitis]|uniref:AraC-type DNA-binding protein n=1 Tax=Dysgonomonas macrotermitis TaxID=1346286 RepID=A0A1M4WES2_9BACT|nr:helix-turn-helix domain-containing protein [Dysgonomonas macrotermitis]SHE79685.1 AraC-type DNA-binding protein [Dysgonomonas macrotermitis]
MNVKKKGKLIFTLFFLSFIQLSVIAQSQDMLKMKESLFAKMDSCNNDLLKLDQKEKRLILFTANTIGEHEVVARFFKQKKLFGEEYLVQMMKYVSKNNLDSIYFYYKKAENYYLNNDKEAVLFINVLRGQFVSWCVLNSYSELAINTLKQNIEYNSVRKVDADLWTYMSLMEIYRTVGKHEQAIEVGKMGLKQPNLHPQAFELKITICCEIAESYYMLGDYQRSLAYSDSILAYNKNIPDKFQPEFGANVHKVALFNFYMFKSVAYSFQKDFDQVSLMLQKMEDVYLRVEVLESLNNAINEMYSQKYWANMVYNYQKGDYSKAMEYLNESKELAIPFALTPDYKNTPKWEALILEKQGKYKEANLALKELLHLTDSINKAHTAKEISSLWAIFEVDKAQQAKENSEQRVKIIAVSTSTIIFLAIILIIYFVVTNKKLKRKNMLLFKQQKEMLSPIPVIVNRHAELIPERDSEISQKEGQQQNTEQTLYSRIIEFLKTTKQYTDPDISRDSLAKELGTNRQYIIGAISDNANMSFNEFINSFRIDYARNLLLNEEDILIKEVYTEAGFKNRNTFSQLFKERFGMSPSEFRDCADEERTRE